MIKRIAKLSSKKCEEKTFAKCIRGEALKLATEANIVAKGLTAMVTIDEDKCTKLDDEAEICLDGTTPDGTPPLPYYDYDDGESAPEMAYAAADTVIERSAGRAGAKHLVMISILAFLFLGTWCVMW